MPCPYLGRSGQTGDLQRGSRSGLDESEDGIQTVLVVVGRLHLKREELVWVTVSFYRNQRDEEREREREREREIHLP